MVLRNAALLITNDNGQGIMETIIVLLALLSQILGLFGFVFSCLLFLRFGKVKGWFNKKAGTEIVSSFSFRSLRTLIVTGVLGFVMMMVALLCSVGLFIDKTPTDTQMYWFAGTFVALTLVYPVWRVIRRIVRCSRAENRKAERKFEKTDRMKIIRKIYPGVRKRYEKKASNACTGRKLRLSLHRV